MRRDKITPVIGSSERFLALHYFGLLFLAIAFLFAWIEDPIVTPISMGIGGVLFLSGGIYYWILIHRAWNFVIAASQRLFLKPSCTSADRAVGFCFMPVYNLFWLFIGIGQLPRDLRAIEKRLGRPTRLMEGLGTMLAGLSLVSVIPFAGYVTAPICTLVVLPLFITQVVRAAKALDMESIDAWVEEMSRTANAAP